MNVKGRTGKRVNRRNYSCLVGLRSKTKFRNRNQLHIFRLAKNVACFFCLFGDAPR